MASNKKVKKNNYLKDMQDPLKKISCSMKNAPIETASGTNSTRNKKVNYIAQEIETELLLGSKTQESNYYEYKGPPSYESCVKDKIYQGRTFSDTEESSHDDEKMSAQNKNYSQYYGLSKKIKQSLKKSEEHKRFQEAIETKEQPIVSSEEYKKRKNLCDNQSRYIERLQYNIEESNLTIKSIEFDNKNKVTELEKEHEKLKKEFDNSTLEEREDILDRLYNNSCALITALQKYNTELKEKKGTVMHESNSEAAISNHKKEQIYS